MRAPDGRERRWVGGVQYDVTSVVKAKREMDPLVSLLLRRQRFDQALLDGVEVGIVTSDPRGVVIFVNRSTQQRLGVQAASGERSVSDLLALPSDLGSVLDEAGDDRIVQLLTASDGREIELEIELSRAEGSGGEPLGYFFVLRDHAEERHRELERRRLERLAAMGTMVAGFAHEVRNPMASLRSLAESLAEELSEAGQVRPHVGRMLGAIERVERLVKSSLSFGCPAPPRAGVHRPASLVLAAASSLLPRTRPQGELGLDVEAELPDVRVDEGQLVQILVILLENALDAAGSPARVTLSASLESPPVPWRGRRTADSPPAEVRFSVRDHGPGVPPERRERIFDPFYTTKASGTGLGLSIAQHLAAENGARLELASSPGGPTTFSVLLAALPRSAAASLAP